MRIVRLILLAGLAAAAMVPAPAAAQSDILLRLRSGSPLGDRFRVDSAGGFVAMGALGLGIIPYTGSGERTMWYPFKGAFRSGGIGFGGTMWDDANVGFYSWAGGYNTTASGIYTVALGDGAQATNTGSVAIGHDVVASGQWATALGERTQATSRGTFAVGANCSPVATCASAYAGTSWRGASNGNGSSVAMGQYVTADAQWSIALGYRASTAGRVGSFVFGGSLNGASAATDSIRALADGEFAARAPGGFRFRTNTTTSTGCNLPAGSGVFSCSSSRLLKHGFAEVDGEQLLAGIRAVPVTTWSYDAEGSQVRHMGPFAEDFRAAFGLGVDDTSIGLLDIAGVNFAGVQALERRTAQQRAEMEALRTENESLRGTVEALRAQNDEMEGRLRRLEALMQPQAAPTP